jgi:hypothetical protein
LNPQQPLPMQLIVVIIFLKSRGILNKPNHKSQEELKPSI